MRIGLTSIFVDDQDQAERFYSEVLGLKIKTSAPYHPGDRWLTVVSPEDPDGVELVLHVADDPARVFREASRAIGRPAIWYAPLIQWHALAGAKRATGVLVAPYQTVGPAAEEAGSR